MSFKNFIIIFVAIAFFNATFVQSHITYVANWQIPYPGALDSRAIYFIGDPNAYEIFPDNYLVGKESDAQCERLLNDQPGHFTGPCETSVASHTQSFIIQCTADRKNAASVVFFKNGGATDHQASIVTAGNMFGGFTNEKKDQPLRQSTTKAIIGQGDRISVVLNCGSSDRSHFGTR